MIQLLRNLCGLPVGEVPATKLPTRVYVVEDAESARDAHAAVKRQWEEMYRYPRYQVVSMNTQLMRDQAYQVTVEYRRPLDYLAACMEMLSGGVK